MVFCQRGARETYTEMSAVCIEQLLNSGDQAAPPLNKAFASYSREQGEVQLCGSIASTKRCRPSTCAEPWPPRPSTLRVLHEKAAQLRRPTPEIQLHGTAGKASPRSALKPQSDMGLT